MGILRPAEKQADVGVVVGRFQVHELTEGHHDLLQSVSARHKRVLVLIGNSPLPATRRNPLDYQTRRHMVQDAYPEAMVSPLKDMPTDDHWSVALDDKIEDHFSGENSVLIYGSRDGFIPHYRGKFDTVELEPRVDISGSEIRRSLAESVRQSPDFRHGVVYAAFAKFPTSFQCVDAAVYKASSEEVALCRKRFDPPGKWRFPGGFVQTDDQSLEEAVRREAREELSSPDLGDAEYIASLRIHDWRYRNETDGILSAFYLIPYNFGPIQGSDDVVEARMFKLAPDVRETLIEEHKKLFDALTAHLRKGQD